VTPRAVTDGEVIVMDAFLRPRFFLVRIAVARAVQQDQTISRVATRFDAEPLDPSQSRLVGDACKLPD
jgi:hypothetical protein